jgi:predicted Rossmann fold nucleotide-binding protein DprA/Smf involved in DNA uptake
MKTYIRVLRQRVRASRYAVDEGAVAEAVLARARPRLNANARKRLARLDQQIKQFRVENRGAVAPARSVRRATARRASTRRATARRRQHDTTAPIVEFLNKHPQSTAGDLAKSLNLDPESVSTSLNQLVIAGDIEKHAHGYSTAN